MKSLKLRFVLLCVATILTLNLSYAVAHAGGTATCANEAVGGNAYGDYDCKLAGSCGGFCYYQCECKNLFPGSTCNDVLKEAGFEIVAEIPCTD
jgi:hypothetical protein